MYRGIAPMSSAGASEIMRNSDRARMSRAVSVVILRIIR